ncbi:MAG TPA: metalloregulator ArsR/SmtB family transcription factor [Kiloniellales bacterium]|jgi:ubiquinone/menaquinone biosynthesis C-methylase UbiE/DNA-binding transcriptional ArsR family regulator|nr:metalloregulator ArsR/SmtB family transcription factor [Kiloniellales bacterium]
MDDLLQGLRAAAEPTRLRILALCAHAELTVSDLVEILGQSQPRVSRHLKLLVDAGLLLRHQEGSFAYYRLADRGAGADLARQIVDLLPPEDPLHAADLERLQQVQDVWAVKAASYFRRNAANWSRLRALHANTDKVDTALRQLFEREPAENLLDVGTGAGHILQLLGAQVENAVGIDLSRDMLTVARANLFRGGLRHCQVRQAEMTALPFPAAHFDAVTLHMVLHYAQRPGAAIREAARVLRPGGRLVVVDFLPHEREELRSDHAHRWLGFSDAAIADFLVAAGLVADPPRHLGGDALTVALWLGRRPANDTEEADQSTTARGGN